MSEIAEGSEMSEIAEVSEVSGASVTSRSAAPALLVTPGDGERKFTLEPCSSLAGSVGAPQADRNTATMSGSGRAAGRRGIPMCRCSRMAVLCSEGEYAVRSRRLCGPHCKQSRHRESNPIGWRSHARSGTCFSSVAASAHCTRLGGRAIWRRVVGRV